MKQYYECHITMVGNPNSIEHNTKGIGWKFSKIDGDPDLGKGVKCYATMHYSFSRNNEEDIVEKVNQYADFLNEFLDIEVIRRKVELVVYDSKQDLTYRGDML